MWLWELRDVGVIGVGLLVSILALTQTGIFIPLVFTAVYAFLSIRFDGTPEEVFSNPKELSDIGLSVPAPTQIASALREQGVEIEGSVYTTEQLLAALLKLKKEVGRNA